MMPSFRRYGYVWGLIAVLFFSCSNDDNAAPVVSQPLDFSGTGQIAFRGNWETLETNFQLIDAEVYDQNKNLLQRKTFSRNQAVKELKIEDVPAGTNRRLLIYAGEGISRVIFRGESNGVTVVTGKTTTVPYINSKPFITKLISPLKGTIFNSNSFTLKWEPVAGVSQYHVFVNPIVNYYTTATNYTYSAPQPVNDGQNATDGDDGAKVHYLFPDTGQTTTYSLLSIIKTEDGDIKAVEKQPSYSLLDNNGADCSGNMEYTWSISAVDEFGREGMINDDSSDSFEQVCAMVRDNVTGLIWEVKINDNSMQDKDNTYFWTEAHTYVEQLNTVHFGGSNLPSRWRLPTIKELATIVNSQMRLPAIKSQYFPTMMQKYYWSSTEYADNKGIDAWCVDFAAGEIHTQPKEVFQNDPTVYVIAVNGGPQVGDPFDPDDADDQKYGTITDKNHELMWMQPPSLLQLFGREEATWEEALIFCENLILYSDGSWGTQIDDKKMIYVDEQWKEYDFSKDAVHNDWRLPNRNELMSLVDYNQNNTAFPRRDDGVTPYFSSIQASNYWTSTTAIGDDGHQEYTENAWIINLKDGSIGTNYKKEATCLFLAVRDCSVQR